MNIHQLRKLFYCISIPCFILLIITPKIIFAQEYYFNDEFSGETVDTNKWIVYENKGCPVQPSVEILKSGFIKFNQCKNKPRFPYVVSKINPFPQSNYSIEIAFQYTKVTYWGTGIVLTDHAPPNGGVGNPSLIAIDVWQDKSAGPNMRIEFNGQMVHTIPINTQPHIFKVERSDKKYFVYLDNILVFTSPETAEEAKYVWMGNPGYISPPIPEWTEFKVDYIRVIQTSPTKLPVIFIPGIGGSELKATEDIFWIDQDNGHGGEFSHAYAKDEKVWVNHDEAIKLGNDDYFDVLRLKPDGQTSEANLSLTGELTSLGYGDVDPFFTSNGYTKGNNFFIFPYDWRKDIRTTKESLDALVETAKKQTGASKANIVAHSMGGLVARYYISDPEKAKNVNKLISLGTPYLGSVDALKAIMYGNDLKQKVFGIIPIGIPRSQMKDVSQNLTSIFQLLPTKKFYSFYDNSSKDKPFPFYDGRDIDRNNIAEALSFLKTKQLLDNLNHNMTVYNIALNFRDVFDTSLATDRIDVVQHNIIGSGQPTLGQIKETYWITWPIKLLPRYEETFINGDDTVPLYSASLKSDGKDLSAGAAIYYVEQKHSDLVNQNGSAMQLVKAILSEGDAIPVEVKSEKIKLNGKHISVDQDAELDLYDDQGNHTGIKDDRIETNIPETFYDTFGDTKHAFIKSKSKTVTVKVKPKKNTAQKVTTPIIHIRHHTDDKIVKTSIYRNKPANKTTDTPIEFVLNPQESTSPNVVINNETIIPVDITGDAIADSTPPVTKIEVQGGTITLTPTDIESGVSQTEYSLDNGETVQTYTQPVTVNDTGSHTLQVFSTDKLGNQELPQTVTFTINQPSSSPIPTPTITTKPATTTVAPNVEGISVASSEQSSSDNSQGDTIQIATSVVSLPPRNDNGVIKNLVQVFEDIIQKPIDNVQAVDTQPSEVLGVKTSTKVAMKDNIYQSLWEFIKYPAVLIGILSSALLSTIFNPTSTILQNVFQRNHFPRLKKFQKK